MGGRARSGAPAILWLTGLISDVGRDDQGMADEALAQAVRAVDRVAGQAEGRLLAVTPLGTRGNPHDPDRLDQVTATSTGLLVSVGSGHAVYRLTGPVLEHADASCVRLLAQQLDVVFTAYGSSGTVEDWHWDDAELVLTWDPDVAARAHRTRGTRRQEGPA